MITICSSFKLILQVELKLPLCLYTDELKLWIAMQSNANLKKERVLLSMLFVGNMIGSLFLLLIFLILVILVLLHHIQSNKRKKIKRDRDVDILKQHEFFVRLFLAVFVVLHQEGQKCSAYITINYNTIFVQNCTTYYILKQV